MKNIVICFDGTWNTSDAPDATNVVKTARLLSPLDPKGTVQVVFYDSGVGSERVAFGRSINNLLGGAFGVGLMNNIEDAYRFLIFNYTLGDRLFVFGFSRGAFSARSFGGLLRNCGILRKENINLVSEAIKRYRNRNPDPNIGADDPKQIQFRAEHSVPAWTGEAERKWRLENFDPSAVNEPRLQIEYLGIWDTVGAMGVPGHIFFSNLFNKRFQFHDCALSRMVKNARHAVAIDERRRIFDATLWDNLPKLNKEAGFADSAIDKRPYLQQWFPGDHGSVGGGGDIVGLSNASLVWVIDGAVAQGLGVHTLELQKYRDKIDPFAPLQNMTKPPFDITAYAMRKSRKALWELKESDLSWVARERLSAPAAKLPKRKAYLPRPLRKLAAGLTKAIQEIVKKAA